MSAFLRISIFAAVGLVFAGFTQVGAQTPEQRGGTPQEEAARIGERSQKMLGAAAKSFREGLIHLKEGDEDVAKARFDAAVGVFYSESLGTQALKACSNQLIESVRVLETPSMRSQAGLAIARVETACGWDFEEELVAAVLARKSRPAGVGATGGAESTADAKSDGSEVRDADEEYERFVRDVLPGFELKGGEEADTEEGRQQLDYINQVVSNRSLGITFQGHPMILQFISYYQSRGRSTMSTGLYRSGMFMRMARRIFREEGVPEQVAWLGQVESAWKPLALSWASASGLWQFIPSTGERFGLRRTAYVDERNSFESATRASARYLRWLANRYNGNWELALAAYNSGEGNVDRAISRAGVANFWAAYPYLPRETRNYVPNILATIIIANNPNKYGFGHVRPASPLQWDSVRVPGSTSLAFLAQASDTTVEYLRYLNPELRTSMTPPEPYVVRVPLTKGKDVIAMFKKLPAGRRGEASLASSYSGETWQSISARTGVPVEQLRAANPGMNVPKGRVIVPITGTGNVARTTSQRPAVKAESSKKPESARKEQSVRTVKVRKGDTLTKIASENKVSVSELAKANGISPNTPLQSGKSLKIPAK